MDGNKFRALSPHYRALVAIAVLLDGREASTYLELDAQDGELLRSAAQEVSSLEPELRMAYAGTMLRAALQEL